MVAKTIKRKHVSNKKKDGWRKNFNLTGQLDDLTEEKNFLERTGHVKLNAIMEDKKPAIKKLPSKKLQKQKALETLPQCFASLENSSKVQDPIAARNIPKKPEIKTGGSYKLKIRSIKSEESKVDFDHDLWADDDKKKKPEGYRGSEWYGIDIKRHHLEKTTFVAPKITLEKRNRIKPVEVPVVGSSYNPSASDLEQLVDMTLDREQKIMKKEERFANSLKKVYAKVSRNQIKRWKREEFIQGFPIDENQKDDDDEIDATNAETIPVVNKKKDLKKRRKQKEEKLRRAKSRLTAIEIAKMKDLKKLDVFEKQIAITDESLAAKKTRKVEKREQAKYQPGRLARTRYPGDELPNTETPKGNLRKVTIDDSTMLVDRFKSLQKRNIIPVSIKRKPRKGRLAVIKKNSHKNQL